MRAINSYPETLNNNIQIGRLSIFLYSIQQPNFTQMVLPFSHIKRNTFHTSRVYIFASLIMKHLYRLSKFQKLKLASLANWEAFLNLKIFEDLHLHGLHCLGNLSSPILTTLKSNLVLLSNLTVLIPTNFNQKLQPLLLY